MKKAADPAIYPEAVSRTDSFALRVKSFAAGYRNYFMLLFLLALTIWMVLNWYGTIRRILNYYTPLPIWDYWSVVEDFPKCKALNFQFLWRQHNEHRIVFPEIIFMLDMLLWHGRQILSFAISFLCYFSTWLAIAWTVFSDSHLSRAVRATAILLAGIVIGWQGSVSLLAWPFLLQWTLTGFAAALSLACLSLAGTKKTFTRCYLVLAIIAAVIVNYSSGNGLLFWPVVIAAGFVLPLRKPQRIGLIVSAVVSIGIYFIGYRFSHDLDIANFYLHPFYSVGFIASYLSMPFGAIGVTNSPHFGVCVGLASLAAAILVLLGAARAKLLSTRPAVVLFGFYAFVLLTAIITAAGRMNPADAAFIEAKAPRYITVPIVNWAVLVSLCLWFIGRRQRKAVPVITACFVLLLSAGFFKLREWVQGNGEEFANAQEAILSLEDGLMVPKLMRKIYPDPTYIPRYLPVLENNHLSIYYKPRSRWFGLPASRFGPLLRGYAPGSITEAFPVPSGVEISGWADDGRDPVRYRWIILANERDEIVGFGERVPAGVPSDPVLRNPGNPRLLSWVGFVNAKNESRSYQAYVVDPAGLFPLRGSVLAPRFAAAKQSRPQ